MFNVCVNAVVREWLQQVLGDNTAQRGLGEAARNHAVAFFVNNGLVAARFLEWLQSSFTILVNLFERIGLQTNATKTKVMTCLPGLIQVARTEEEYAAQQTGNAVMTKRWRIDCKVCGISLVAESLQSHLETQHDIYRLFELNWDLVPERAAVVYHATELPATGIYLCPVPQCGGHSGTRFNLRRHFLIMQHLQDLVCILIKGSLPLPKCAHCRLQTPVRGLSRGHHCTGLCQRGWERICQHEAAVCSKRALEHTFSANGEELERVEVFKYLGWLISHDDADTQAMQSNLRKARGC
jgi:hypothetical protein